MVILGRIDPSDVVSEVQYKDAVIGLQMNRPRATSGTDRVQKRPRRCLDPFILQRAEWGEGSTPQASPQAFLVDAFIVIDPHSASDSVPRRTRIEAEHLSEVFPVTHPVNLPPDPRNSKLRLVFARNAATPRFCLVSSGAFG